MIGPFRDLLKDLKSKQDIDICIVDFYSHFGSEVCDELGLNLIYHLPGSVNFTQYMMQAYAPFAPRYTSWCGIFCICPTLLDFFSSLAPKKLDMDPISQVLE